MTIGASQRVLQAVAEQGSVRKLRQRIVERCVSELAFEGLALGYVPAGEHHPLDARLLHQVGGDDFAISPGAIRVSEPQLGRVHRSGCLEDAVQECLSGGLIFGMDEFQIVAAKHAGADVAPDLFGGWAHIANETVRVQDDDQVTSVLHEGAEFFLALPLGSQRGVLRAERSFDLGTPEVALGELAQAPVREQGRAGKEDG